MIKTHLCIKTQGEGGEGERKGGRESIIIKLDFTV